MIEKVFVVNSENKHAESLVKKISKHWKDGAIIFVTDDEFRAWNDIKIITLDPRDVKLPLVIQ